MSYIKKQKGCRDHDCGCRCSACEACAEDTEFGSCDGCATAPCSFLARVTASYIPGLVDKEVECFRTTDCGWQGELWLAETNDDEVAPNTPNARHYIYQVTASQTGGPGTSETLEFCYQQLYLVVTGGPDICLDANGDPVACDSPNYDHSEPFYLSMYCAPRMSFECCCQTTVESNPLEENNWATGTAAIYGCCAMPEYLHLSSEWCVNVHFPNLLYCEQCQNDSYPDEYMPWAAVLKRTGSKSKPKYVGLVCSLLPQAVTIHGGSLNCFPFAEAVIEIDPDDPTRWKLTLNGDKWVGFKPLTECSPNPAGNYAGGAGPGCTQIPLQSLPDYQQGFWKDLGRIYAKALCAADCGLDEVCYDCESCGTCPDCSATDRWGAPSSVAITVGDIDCGPWQDIISRTMEGGSVVAHGVSGCRYEAADVFTLADYIQGDQGGLPFTRTYPVSVAALFLGDGRWHVSIDWVDDTIPQQPISHTYDGWTQDGLTCCQGGSGQTETSWPNDIPCGGTGTTAIPFSVSV